MSAEARSDRCACHCHGESARIILCQKCVDHHRPEKADGD